MTAPAILSPVADAVYNVLNGDTALKAMLGAHKEIAGLKGIYTSPTVPLDAAMPYVHTYGQMGRSEGTKNSYGNEVSRDIVCYAENNGTSITAESIIDKIYQLFCRASLTVTGYAHAFVVEVSGPFVVPTSEEYVGLAITVRLKLQTE